MPRIELTIHSDVPPGKVMAAATDFSDRRPDLWPAVSRRFWQLHAQGHNWAEATAGTEMPGGVWARERHEWNRDRILATVLDSNGLRSGTRELRVAPDGDGSIITVVDDRRPKGKGLLFAPVMMLFGKKILAGHLQKTLDLIR